MFPLICGMLGYFQFDFVNPILGLRLDELEVGEKAIGLFFCIGPTFYLVGSLFTTKIGSRCIEK